MSTPAPRGLSAPPEGDAELYELPCGPRVVDLLSLAYRTRLPVLLEGPTGIGKSQLVEQFAEAQGIGRLTLDLSLLEPPDLVGLPELRDGRTHYATPAELPTSGAGVLMLEELNRAELPVMQPALQLLTARRLHGYTLPPGWSCIAAINPEDGDYQVQSLDPALRSRFLQVRVRADRGAWLEWAQRAGVHPVVQRIVRADDRALEQVPPRSWAYVSDVLHELRGGELADDGLRMAALRGYLPAAWAERVAVELRGAPPGPEVESESLLGPEGDAYLASILGALPGRGSDAEFLVGARIERALGRLDPDVAAGSGLTLDVLERRLAPLAGDLKDRCLAAAARSPAAATLLANAGGVLDVADGAALEDWAARASDWSDRHAVHRLGNLEAAVMAALGTDGLHAHVEGLRALARAGAPHLAGLESWLARRGPGGA